MECGTQLVFRDDRSGGVVGIAQIDDIYTAVGYLWSEVVFCRTRHVHHIAPLAILHHSCPAYHHIRVDINGIDGVGYTDTVVPSHQLLYIACVALGTIVHENL